MLGRGRLRKAVAEFIERERELVEPPPAAIQAPAAAQALMRDR